MTVTRLLRTSYGPFELKNLQRGSIEEVAKSELLINCKEFFKDQNVKIPEIQVQEKPKTKGKGWAKSKPKKNAKPKRKKQQRKKIEK